VLHLPHCLGGVHAQQYLNFFWIGLNPSMVDQKTQEPPPDGEHALEGVQLHTMALQYLEDFFKVL
jgi:hypothetical protein